MKSYLNDVNASDANRTNLAIFRKTTSSPPPMLEIFIVLNEKDAEKRTGEGGGGERDYLMRFFLNFFFGIRKKYLGLPPKKRLF